MSPPSKSCAPSTLNRQAVSLAFRHGQRAFSRAVQDPVRRRYRRAATDGIGRPAGGPEIWQPPGKRLQSLAAVGGEQALTASPDFRGFRQIRPDLRSRRIGCARRHKCGAFCDCCAKSPPRRIRVSLSSPPDDDGADGPAVRCDRKTEERSNSFRSIFRRLSESATWLSPETGDATGSKRFPLPNPRIFGQITCIECLTSAPILCAILASGIRYYSFSGIRSLDRNHTGRTARFTGRLPNRRTGRYNPFMTAPADETA